MFFRRLISRGLTMLSSLISSSMDLLIAFLYMIRATVSYATYACVSIFGLHPPCFHPGVSGLCLTVPDKANECGQYSRRLPSAHPKLYKQKLAKRKVREWFVEGMRKSHNAASIGISSGDEEAMKVQVQWKNSIKVFPEDLINYHAVYEHESIIKFNCDKIDDAKEGKDYGNDGTDFGKDGTKDGLYYGKDDTIDDAKDGMDYGKDGANITQPLATHDYISASTSSIYQPFNELQETDARPTDGGALVSDIFLDSAKEHVGNELDVYACRSPPSHGLQDTQEEHVGNKLDVYACRPPLSHGLQDTQEEHVDNKLDVYACRPPPSHGLQYMQEEELNQEIVAQKPRSMGYEFNACKMLQGMPCELCHVSAKLKEKLSAVRQTLDSVHSQLERQRTASSVAAQESMAMISMLQREKAALLLEAMQHQRMAEEKEMFNENAVMDMRDCLVKREAELLTLEKEMELYRRKILKAQVEGIEQKQVNDGVMDGEANIQKHLMLEYPGAGTGTDIGHYTNTIREPCNMPICPSSCISTEASSLKEMRGVIYRTIKSQGTVSQDSSPDLRSRSMIVRDTSRVKLQNEASELSCRLRAVEADRKLLRRTLELRRKERWEIQLLQEVAGSLRLLHSSSCKRPAIGSRIRLRRACSVSAVEAEILHPKRPRRMEQ